MFAEPMIATAFLGSHPSITTAIKAPAQYVSAGYYPTSYTVAYDGAAKEFKIALGGFVSR